MPQQKKHFISVDSNVKGILESRKAYLKKVKGKNVSLNYVLHDMLNLLRWR